MSPLSHEYAIVATVCLLLSGCGTSNPSGVSPKPPLAAIPGKPLPLEISYRGCPPWGSGGEDPFINQLKNRVDLPTRPRTLSFAQIEQLDWPPGITDIPTAQWTPSARARIFWNDGLPVSFVGYISEANASGPEPANCGGKAGSDWHMWMGVHPHAAHPDTFFAESTPRVRAREKGFSLTVLDALASRGTKVRITGWLMFDSEHPEQPNNRATLWEIHPVTAIDVQTGGRWRRIAG